MTDIGAWLDRAAADGEFAWFCRGLSVRLVVGLGPRREGVLLAPEPRRLGSGECVQPDIAIAGSDIFFDQIFRSAPAPGYQSFGAWLRHDVGVHVEAEPLLQAQCLAALERLVELARPASAEIGNDRIARDPGEIVGRRRLLETPDGRSCLIYWLEAGRGPPLLFLHTAGADSRQYLHQLADLELQSRYRMLAFDMPWHGQSAGTGGIESTSAYRLTGSDYEAWTTAFIEAVAEAPVIIVGCSMGAAMALTMTAKRPDLVAGCIGLEAPFRAPGRRSGQLTDARIANGWHNPAYVRALLGPAAPKRRRDEACAIYAQARPGVYMGDLSYYSDEYDGAALADGIRESGRPVALLTGSYDYSASPDNTRQLHAAIGAPAVRFSEMPGLGHFPMIEDPDRFRPHLLDALAMISGDEP